MRYLFFLSIFLLIIFFTFLVLLMFKNKKIKNKYFLIFLFSFIFGFSLFSIFLKPSPIYDLYRHYEIIEQIRIQGYSAKTIYDNFFVIKILYFLISLSKNNFWLQFFSCTISYSIFSYILFQFRKAKVISNKFALISVFLFLCLMPFAMIYSGVRNTLAFSILALAVYFDIYKKKKNIFVIILYIIPIFIHFSSLIIISLRILYIFYDKICKYKYLLFFWSFFIQIISSLLLKFNNINYLYSLGLQLKSYIFQYLGDIRMFIVNFIMLLLFYFITNYIIKKNKILDKNIKNIVNFLLLIYIFMIGSICVPNIIERLFYFVGILSPFVIFTFIPIKKTRIKVILFSILIIYFIGNLSYQIVGLLKNGITFLTF